MAPSAMPMAHDDIPYHNKHSGKAMEAISDKVDAVNVLAASIGEKTQEQFRNYENATASVKAFYAEQHTKQTVAYNLKARHDFKFKSRPAMTIWEAAEKLDTLIDESDPDTDLSQIEHLLQASEAMRAAGKPRWMILTGFIHDLGKLLNFYGAEGQWDVVGDTFPVGCAFDSRIILSETFVNNPDSQNPIYSTKHGIYSPGCGMDNMMLSWGHDEYLYLVVKEQSTLPDEALAMIRYHSFYPWHSRGAYREFMTEKDHRMLKAVQEFNPFDLYSKGHEKPDIQKLKVCNIVIIYNGVADLKQPYYLELIDEFFPNPIVQF